MVISPYFFFMASACWLGRVLADLKMSRIGQVLEAIRSSFSFSVSSLAAGLLEGLPDALADLSGVA